MSHSYSSSVAGCAFVGSILIACGGGQPEPVAPAAGDATPATASAAPQKVAAKNPAGAVGQSCGTRGAAACPANMYCDYVPGDECGATDKPGHCATRPEACTANADPACGCDGKTYSNACIANVSGVGVKKNGPCS